MSRLLAVGLLFAVSPFSGCASGRDDGTDDFFTTGGRPGSGGRSSGTGSDGNPGGESSVGGMGGDSVGVGGHGGDWTPDPLTCETLVCQAGTCEDHEEGAACDCPSGFGGIDCTDKNECANPLYCGGYACMNTFGSAACECDALTVAADAPEFCADLDECELGACDENAKCTNSSSGFSCECEDGFFGNGWDCTDTDVCAGDPCGEGTCVATSAGARCQCPLGTGGADCSLTCDLLNITDPALKAAVFQATGLYPETIVPANDLVGITSLDISDRLIASLDGLECWPTLERLDARGLRLDGSSDATPLDALASLTRLTSLDLSCGTGLDLSALEGHPALRLFRLSMKDCGDDPITVAGLGAIGTMKRLESLEIGGTSLGTGSGVEGLRSLRSLTLEDVGLTDASALGALRLLGDLYLANNDISDASSLVTLTNLRNLSLASNSLADLDFLAQMKELGTLDVSDTGIGALPSFSSNPRLRWLRARGNEIENLTPITTGLSLGLSDLSDNRIESLEPLRGQDLRGDLTLDDNAPLEEDCDETLEMEAELRAGGLRVVSTCDVETDSN